MTDSTYFPFSAIVGQEAMKDALLCNAVQPDIGGVLIAGTRGTAKSTAVRSLAHVLPKIETVAECPFNCPPNNPALQCEDCTSKNLSQHPELIEKIPTPFVNLPIGATEDRVLGSIDLESAIQEGERSFEPGLLARANRGILYIDEVNLLSDHLVDVLLDAAAMGTNRVEREGISFEHPADVMLVGTMNPEEGELRPQLLDRFGLYVNMDEEFTPDERKAVVKRRTHYEENPAGMFEEWRDAEGALANRISTARDMFPDVQVSDDILDLIASICIENNVDGLRADIIIHRTARALAALDNSRGVESDHVRRAAELALGHRSQSNQSQQSNRPDSQTEPSDSPHRSNDKPSGETLPSIDPPASQEGDTDSASDHNNKNTDDENQEHHSGSVNDQVFPITPGWTPPQPSGDSSLELPKGIANGGGPQISASGTRGNYYGAKRPRGRPRDIALDATIRAAAPYQPVRQPKNTPELAITLTPTDLRVKQRQTPTQQLVVFVVDSSGSMGNDNQMSKVKGGILSLLKDAYQDRKRVSLIGFRQDRAEIVLQPTSDVQRAAQALAQMPTGGRTPLASGLERGLRLVRRELRENSDQVPLLVIVTDGRSNYSASAASPVDDALAAADQISRASVSAVCFDTESGPVRLGHVSKLAEAMGAEYYHLHDFTSRDVSATVNEIF